MIDPKSLLDQFLGGGAGAAGGAGGLGGLGGLGNLAKDKLQQAGPFGSFGAGAAAGGLLGLLLGGKKLHKMAGGVVGYGGGRGAHRYLRGHFADLENNLDTSHLVALEQNLIDHRCLETGDRSRDLICRGLQARHLVVALRVGRHGPLRNVGGDLTGGNRDSRHDRSAFVSDGPSQCRQALLPEQVRTQEQ